MARTNLGGALCVSVLGLTVVGLGGTAQAVPVVLDFGDGGLIQPPTFAPPYTEDGFRFTTINQVQPDPEQDHFDVYNVDGFPMPGERELEIHTANDGDEVIIDFFGAPFSLLSLVIELWDEPSTGVWKIEASNGAMRTFTGAGLETFGGSWSGITSFTLRPTSVPDVGDFSGRLDVDDITLETDPSLPAPGAASLLAAAAAAWLARRSRRR